VNRRQLLLVSGAMAMARPLRAQQALPVIGFLSSEGSSALAPRLAAFSQGLSETGYVEGQNVAIEYRWAKGRFDRLPELAADLVGRSVDVIATSGGEFSAVAAKNATSLIPIVFLAAGDPVEEGLVASLARPGGNLTGVTFIGLELWGKRVELISELVPETRALAALMNPNFPGAERNIKAVEEAGRAKGLQLRILRAATESEIDAAFTALAELQARALLVGAPTFLG
jgi:putative ABC transport system substrate-binding protein